MLNPNSLRIEHKKLGSGFDFATGVKFCYIATSQFDLEYAWRETMPAKVKKGKSARKPAAKRMVKKATKKGTPVKKTKKAAPRITAVRKSTATKIKSKATAKKPLVKNKKARVTTATAKKPIAKKAIIKKSIVKKPKAAKAATKKPLAKKLATKMPKTSVVKKPVVKKPIEKKLGAFKPVVKTPAEKKSEALTHTAKTLVEKKPTALTPAAKTPPASKTPAKPLPRRAAEALSTVSSLANIGIMGIAPYQPKKNELYMNPKQGEHFTNILWAWKQALMEEVDRTVTHMKDEAANFPDPNDRASQEEEFSIELRTRDRERKLIKKIDETLQRIKDNDYGYCDACGIEIGIRRLEARPTASLCIDCKTLDEIKERQVIG